MNADHKQDQKICNPEDIESEGLGIKFTVEFDSGQSPAFAIRFQGQVHAYLNRCAHLFLELDWDNGEFFDMDGEYLICANHGALFEPDSGECINGPCYGASLQKLSVKETDDSVVLDDERFSLVPE